MLVELLSTPERMATLLEGMAALAFMTVRVIASIKSCFQFGIAENLVCLIDRGHLLLSVFFRDARTDCFIRVVLSGLLPVSRFDLQFVRILRHAKNFIIILLLAAFQCYLRFPNLPLNMLIARVVFISKVESMYACFVIFGIRRLLGLPKQSMQRVRVQF